MVANLPSPLLRLFRPEAEKLAKEKAFVNGIGGMASAGTPKKQDIEMAVSTSQQIEESPNAYGLPPSTSTDADSTSTKTHVELPSQHTCE